MHTIDTYLPAPGREGTGVFAAIQRVLVRHRERHAHRQTLTYLSDYSERMLRDMGIDPIDLAEALRGRPSPLLYPLRGKPAE